MLDDQWVPLEQQMRNAARAASLHAYVPYSKFAVGAAVCSPDGIIYNGCNIENISFGLSICAERNAIFHAAASGLREIYAVVVFTPTRAPTPPCGACRQVLAEFGADSLVLSFCESDLELRQKLGELLPSQFSAI